MTRKQMMHIQRALGILFILICIFTIYMASTGTTVEDRDILPVFFFAPLGVWYTFSKKLHIEL